MTMTISIEELRQHLNALDKTWMRIDPDHESYTYPCYRGQSKVTNLHLFNKNLELSLNMNHLRVVVLGGIKRKYIAVEVTHYDNVPIDPEDFHRALMAEALKNGKGRKVLEIHRSGIGQNWRDLVKAIKPIEMEEMHTVYDYDC